MFHEGPYREPLITLEPGPRVVPEPRRRGEEGGGECGVCTGFAEALVWSDEHFSLHPPRTCSLSGTMWLASREHVDSFSDLAPKPPPRSPAAGAARDRDVGRRRRTRARLPLGRRRRALPAGHAGGERHDAAAFWEDALPNVSDDKCRTAAEQVVARLEA